MHDFPYCIDLPERDAGLHHSEGSGVHTQKQDRGPFPGVSAQKGLVHGPGIIQWIVDEAIVGETEAVDLLAELSCAFNQSVREIHVTIIVLFGATCKISENFMFFLLTLSWDM